MASGKLFGVFTHLSRKPYAAWRILSFGEGVVNSSENLPNSLKEFIVGMVLIFKLL